MLHFFFGSILWKLGGLVFCIAGYELVRYLVIDKVKQLFSKKKSDGTTKG